jgi:glucosamine kinase
MTAPLVLGIDGGGSKTIIAVADRSGTAQSLARGGGINPMDNPRWREAFAAVVAASAVDAGDVRQVAAALPAYGEVEAVSAVQRQTVSALFPAVPQRVLNDVDGAHFGAFAGGPGILILSGSGSMAWARDAAGASYRVGGWGDGFGDEGSAHWIGMRAINAVSQGLDGRMEASGLVEALFDHLGLDRRQALNSLGAWFASLGHARAEIAALAQLVDDLAAAGDPAATAILVEAAAELAKHMTAIARRVPQGHKLPWSFAGGTFASRTLLDSLVSQIGRPPRLPILPPIGGALLCAATDLGWQVDQAFIERLAATLGSSATAAPLSAEPHRQKLGEQGHA